VARIHIEQLEPGNEVRRLLDWMDDAESSTARSAEWMPPIDVFESPDALEIVADVPGVPVEGLRITVQGDLLLIKGVKHAGRCEHQKAAFHLVERSFGQFARAFRLSGAFDIGRARARLSAGELHIVLPRIVERRGREIRIDIETP
jgi:HSP20 family protein